MSALDRRSFLAAAGALGAAGTTAAADKPAKGGAKPKFRLGLVTYLVGSTWDLKTLLSVCKATSISPVELRTEHKHGVEVTLSKEKRKEVRKQFADAGVAVWGCGSTCDFHHTDAKKVQAQIELCKRFVELAADIGGKGVKVRPNGLPKGVETKKTLAQIGKALVPCGQAADGAGVEIWVEVHGAGTARPPNMKTIMEECGHKSVGITWNSNGTDVKDGSVAEAFKLLSPWIKSCHINALYNDGAGKYPYRELFGLLRGAGYDRATLIEVGQKFDDAKAGAEYLRTYKALWQELARGYTGGSDVKSLLPCAALVAAAAALAPNPSHSPSPSPDDHRVSVAPPRRHTFAIVAYDPQRREWGVAVASKVLAVGAGTPWAKAGAGAVVTQAAANVTYGPRGLELLAKGKTAGEVVKELIDADEERDDRQVGIVDAKGRAAGFTGKGCDAWCGEKKGTNYICLGNLLKGKAVVEEMAAAFEKAKGRLAWRLMAALEAGEKAGGDRRGKQSAAILVVRAKGGYLGLDDRAIDLRVDDHKDPVKELARIVALAEPRPRP